MLLRRRASFADAMALRVAFDCAPPQGPLPSLFCSRHGEVHRSVELLEALAKDDPLSPMTFSLSVHNAAAGLFSIARGDTSAAGALAAGQDTLAEGVIEACGLLGDGAAQVLLVAYDDRLPPEFARFADDADVPAALALLLEPARGPAYSLELGPARGPGSVRPDPQILSVARFLERGDEELEITSGARRWLWRHGG